MARRVRAQTVHHDLLAKWCGQVATHFWSHKHEILATTAVMPPNPQFLSSNDQPAGKSKSLSHLSFDSVVVERLQLLLLNLWLPINNSYPSLDNNGSML